MRNFLNQFRGILAPAGIMRLEGRVFNTAGKFVEGYTGGRWSAQTVGSVQAVVVPGAVKGKVHIVSPMNGADRVTDARSAGLALTILVVSWTWELLADQMNEKQFKFFENLRQSLIDEAYNESNNFDKNAIRAIID